MKSGQMLQTRYIDFRQQLQWAEAGFEIFFLKLRAHTLKVVRAIILGSWLSNRLYGRVSNSSDALWSAAEVTAHSIPDLP